MMIAAFARESRLSVDIVRFYVRLGLLSPETGRKGGSRPYQVFSAIDLEKARVVRVGKALGLRLEEIGSFLEARTFSGAEDDLVIAFLAEQRRRLMERISGLEDLVTFIDDKTAWLKDPSDRLPPQFSGPR